MKIDNIIKSLLITLFIGIKKNIAMLVIAFITGGFGYLLGGVNGFIAMFLFSILVGYLVLLTLIPFGGIFIYWNVAHFIAHWISQICGFDTGIVRLIPMIIYGIVGAFLWIVMSVFGIVVIFALLGAIFKR